MKPNRCHLTALGCLSLLLGWLLWGSPISPAQDVQPAPELKLKRGGTLFDFALCPKQELLAVEGDAKHNLYRFLSLEPAGDINHQGGYSAMVFSPCGKYLAMNGIELGTVEIWDVQARPPRLDRILLPRSKELDVHFNCIMSVSFTEDGEYVLGLDQAPILYYWDWKKERRTEGEIFLGKQVIFPVFVKEGIFGGRCDDGSLRLFQFGKDGFRERIRVPKASIDPNHGTFFITPDAETAVVWNAKEQTVDVHDLTGPQARRIDQLTHFRNHPRTGISFSVQHVAITPDRGVVIVSHRDRAGDGKSLACVAFFPRTGQRFREFGLDPAKQSHLLLKTDVAPGGDTAPDIKFSSDGGRFTFLRTHYFEPRFLDVNRFGPQLLSDHRVEKR